VFDGEPQVNIYLQTVGVGAGRIGLCWFRELFGVFGIGGGQVITPGDDAAKLIIAVIIAPGFAGESIDDINLDLHAHCWLAIR
jgi:hypothetical protein